MAKIKTILMVRRNPMMRNRTVNIESAGNARARRQRSANAETNAIAFIRSQQDADHQV